MSDKIDGLPPPTQRVGDSQRAGRKPVADAGRPDVAAHQDTVNLTQTGKLLAGVEEILAELPDIDRERVEEIKQAIADGDYAIDPELVAEQILRLENELSRG